MKYEIYLLVFAILALADGSSQAGDSAAAQPVHVSHSFSFTVAAPLVEVAPLFGAERERVWAEGWDPQFVYPRPAQDQAGAVFTIHRGGHSATWVSTIHEPEKGRFQYVYFIPGVLVTLIDIHLVSPSASQTQARVTYERTALSPEYNDHVSQMGEADATSGPHWQQAIERYLSQRRKH